MSDKPFYQQKTFWFTIVTVILQILGATGVIPKEIGESLSTVTAGGAVLSLRSAVGRS